MTQKPLDESALREAVAAVGQYGTVAGAARALGLNRSTFQSRIAAAEQRLGITPDTKSTGPILAVKSAKLEEAIQSQAARIKELESGDHFRRQAIELEELRAQRDEAQDKADVAAAIRDVIGVVNERPVTPPKWLAKPAKGSGAKAPGVPTFLLSDIHYGEVVSKAQVGGVNEYNPKIAKARIRHSVQTVIELLRDHLSNAEYPGIIVPVMGDLVSGTIHEELRETNAADVMTTAMDCAGILTWALRAFADEFGAVYAPWVVGNHGRLDKKPPAKGAVHNNWDWLIGMLVQREFAEDDRVTVDVAESVDMQYKVYGKVFQITHGDQFRGGGGIQGALSPWMIGDYRKGKRQQAIGKPYDYLIMAHWHQLSHVNRIIVNGSVKGYDEFASKYNFGFEPPQQWLFITHKTLGINYWMPIVCDPAQKNAPAAKGKWVSVFKQPPEEG